MFSLLVLHQKIRMCEKKCKDVSCAVPLQCCIKGNYIAYSLCTDPNVLIKTKLELFVSSFCELILDLNLSVEVQAIDEAIRKVFLSLRSSRTDKGWTKLSIEVAQHLDIKLY